ncbi:hypothetical protein AB434_3905 [Heyndrickxia coagulans]|nr:hypothetical protein AB434_3905 [Heyndrickxia coagulans]
MKKGNASSDYERPPFSIAYEHGRLLNDEKKPEGKRRMGSGFLHQTAIRLFEKR